MYRVELKAGWGRAGAGRKSQVPNVPCGVERKYQEIFELMLYTLVPNVPCGVERINVDFYMDMNMCWFLMYRVELKVTLISLLSAYT